MPRRVSLPGASELFRATSAPDIVPEQVPTAEQEAAPAPRRRTSRAAAAPAPEPVVEAAPGVPTSTAAEDAAVASPAARRGAASGRVRHDEKITVYVSRDELLALETGRLALRGDFGLAVDRGRIVRESIALAMADLERRGADSDLVRRLNGD